MEQVLELPMNTQQTQLPPSPQKHLRQKPGDILDVPDTPHSMYPQALLIPPPKHLWNQVVSLHPRGSCPDHPYPDHISQDQKACLCFPGHPASSLGGPQELQFSHTTRYIHLAITQPSYLQPNYFSAGPMRPCALRPLTPQPHPSMP